MKLFRDYQSEDIDKIFTRHREGIKSMIEVLATGLGKTVVAGGVIERFRKDINPNARTLWITHTEELIDQSALSIINQLTEDIYNHDIIANKGVMNTLTLIDKQPLIYSNLTPIKDYIGIIKQERLDLNCHVSVASIQTLYRRLNKIPKDWFDLIIVDETHYAMAKTWQDSINYFDKKLHLGLTATPKRLDGLSLSNLYEEIVSDRDIKYGIDNGYLVPIEGVQIKTKLNIDNVKKTAGDLNIKQLEELLNTPERNEFIVQKYLEYCKGKQFLCFAVDIKHAIDLAQAFQRAGLAVDYVVSDEKICHDREHRISLFKTGELLGLINVMILTAGFDYDMVECVITARPTMSETVFLQQIGRGTRTQSGILNGLDTIEDRLAAIANSKKQRLTILDIVDNTNKHSLINTWSLDKDKEPEDMVFVTEDKRLRLIDKKKKEKETKLKHQREEDEKRNLLALPKEKVYYSTEEQRQAPATEKQLAWLRKEGFDVDNVLYTKAMASEALSKISATPKQIEALRRYGYDVSNGVTKSIAKRAFDEIESGAQIKKILKQNNLKSFTGLK